MTEQELTMEILKGDCKIINPIETIVKLEEQLKELRHITNNKDPIDTKFINKYEQAIDNEKEKFIKWVFEAHNQVVQKHNVFENYEFKLVVIKK